MKQVTMESVKQRIAVLESAGKIVGVLGLGGEFELACLRELEQRYALVVEAAGIQKRMQQLVDIINKADNDYCMCGDLMKNHVLGGCESPVGMFDYHYGKWSESEIEIPATDAAIAALRAEGVEMFAKKCSEKSKQAISSDTRDNWWLCGEHADDFARQLRESKGAQS